jgi:transposase-like protein
MMQSTPREKDIEHMYKDKSSTIDFLFLNGVLYRQDTCPVCNTGAMAIYPSAPKFWHCNNCKCWHKISIYSESFFAKSTIPCNDLLRIAYKWLCGQRYSDILAQTGHSSCTVSWIIRFCWELVTRNLLEEDNILGGDGIVVEVDKSKFGKLKYGRGHLIKGAWVLWGVDKTLDCRMFLKVVPNRSKVTLMEILRKHIAAGSVVHTDLWKGYKNMERHLDVTHGIVNHSQCFKVLVTNVHTNTIKGTWSGVKWKIAPRNQTEELIDDHLFEFVWKRQNHGRLWEAFVECLKNTKYW